METIIENGVVASGAGIRAAVASDARAVAGATERSLAKDLTLTGTKHATQEALKSSGKLFKGAGAATLLALPVVTAAFSQWDKIEALNGFLSEALDKIEALDRILNEAFDRMM